MQWMNESCNIVVTIQLGIKNVQTIIFYHLRKPQGECVTKNIYIATELFFPIDLSFDTVLLESMFDYLVSSLMY